MSKPNNNQIEKVALREAYNSKADCLKTPNQTKIIDIKKGQSLNEVLIKSNEDEEKYTVIHLTEDYLRKNYLFRYNKISIEIEITKIDKIEWSPINENALWIELKKKSINIPMNTFTALLRSGFVEEFNPLKAYFENLPKWDIQTDHICEFGNYIKLDDEKDREQFNINFKKWLVRTVKCTLEPNYFNKQAFVLSDDGNGQNIGKTSWCRFLCPVSLKNYFAEDISNDKDARILLCKNFLINLDELAVLSKREINHLKAYFSKEQINDRLPYDRKNSIIPRVASFIGSTNMSTFLQDETGSVRWIVFSIKDIDWSYKNDFKIDELWSQAYFLAYHDNSFNEIFTPDDIKENEKRNQKYTVLGPERELINKFLKIPEKLTEDNVEFLTATEILVMIKSQSSLHGLSPVTVGKSLKASGFKRDKKNGIYGYYVQKICSDFSKVFTN